MTVPGGTTAPHTLLRADGDVPVDISRIPAREAAERELSEPMYHQNDPNLLQRGLDRFWEWVDDLFSAASGATPGGVVGLVAVVLVAIALVAALWWRLGTPHRSPATAGDSLFADGPRTAEEHRAAAARHASAGDWNQAVQERMRAIVRSLEERVLLDPRPGRTADEAAAEAGRSLPSHADDLRLAARAFDDVTYGGRTADEPAYRRIEELDTALARTRPTLDITSPGARS
ncbi:Putative integral membrane protein [Streptomyces venezuelae]|uniref:DUF4129 domain-containing protein n=1 Tax=Streptomyces gardneri TaxID=66892 RepID=UPI0006BDCF4E|nr:DUF4129 domain-containing protein [Streptomyces gardneri]ALO08798.1 Putative integral membrane protein [Streptomyces venezuelae]QPK45977.1 DUF4129 domain-containing protein [Streptomyces gardneri]WRK37332.1 DUF4129 domain-containing protein [Streptomyces venezuelae]CUM40818.1 Possible membrane protein [Streptomyces venezuelae]